MMSPRRQGDRGLLTLKPSSPRAASSKSYDGKTKVEGAVIKPWADQPWPLIETPSRTQHITHPALHIANEISLIHNAMLRGLNSIYLQAPHVRKTQDVADLLFLTQSWSRWLLDHHHLKETIMLPGFEAALGVPAGTFTLLGIRSPTPTTLIWDRDISPTTTTTTKGKGKERGKEAEDAIASRLRHVYAYASTTHQDPQAYDATALQGLLANLAETLVPHLTRQVGLLASMREMCLGPVSPAAATMDRDDDEMPAPLPVPMTRITKTASASHDNSNNNNNNNNKSPSSPPSKSTSPSPSPPTSSGTSGPTTSAASSPPHSPPRRVSFSLFPSTTNTTPPPKHGKTSSKGSNNNNNNNNSNNSNSNNDNSKIKKNNNTKENNNGKHYLPPDGSRAGDRTMEVIEAEARERQAHARALLEADDRANKLTQVHAAAEAHAASDVDYFVIPPMIVRLRDTTVPTTTSLPSGLSRTSSSSSTGMNQGLGMGMGMGMGGGRGVGGEGNKGDWPRLSVPAVHAIADKLSPRHEGSWRFLPCDVWGRPRELPFSAE